MSNLLKNLFDVADYIHDNPPDFVNEQGCSWWGAHFITKYANEEDTNGRTLEGATGWVIKTKDDYYSYVVIYNDEIVADSQKIEDIFVKIDFLKMV